MDSSEGHSSYPKPGGYPVNRSLDCNQSDAELHMQTVIESSLSSNVPGVSTRPELNVNAQISDALLRDRTMQSKSPQVILLALSRHPKTLRDALLQAPGLQDCRRSLEENGLRVEMDCGAKIFVKPILYEAVICALRLGDYRVNSGTIIVEMDLETVVMEVVRSLPRKEHIRRVGSTKVPLGFAGEIMQAETAIEVKRTFIHVHQHSSLVSTESEGPQTKSTTDAGNRRGKFHRPARGRSSIKGK